MLAGIAVPDQSLWIICALFYLLDNVRVHAPRELLISETFSREWIALLPLYNYRLGGRPVTLTQPWWPFLGVYRIGWLLPDAFSPTSLKRTERLLRFHERRLFPFRLLGSVYFVLLFILAPLQTHFHGLGRTLLLLIPLHIIGILTLVLILLLYRHKWRMGWLKIMNIAFECAVCPGYCANVCRKLSLGFVHIEGDAVAFALERSGPRAAGSIAAGLEFLLEDLSGNLDLVVEDAPKIAAYESRVASIGSNV